MRLVVAVMTMIMGVTDASSSLPKLSNAVAHRGCTQEDAPALEIYLTPKPFDGRGEPALPYVRVEISGREFQSVVGRSMTIVSMERRNPDRTQPTVRAELHVQARAVEWLTGSVTLRSVEPDRAVGGSYDLRGRDGARWTASFTAPWIATSAGCG